MQINRLFEIVYILLEKKNTTARELSEHFEVSHRTIYRDIEVLCQAGIPIYTNRGKGGGLCLLNNFILNKSLLTKQEQEDILSALQGINATNYADSTPVLAKLSSMFQSKNPEWIEVDFSFWNNSEEDRMKFSLLKEAILNRKVITYDYYNSYGQETKRIVEPLKLVFKGQAWYLSGYCREKKDTRYFKISRIKNLTFTGETFETRPIGENENKNTHAPSMDISSADVLRLRFKVDPELAYRVYDEFPMDSITKNPDGSFLVDTTLHAGGYLPGYLMSYEDHIEVLEPAWVRDELIKKYKNVNKIYKI